MTRHVSAENLARFRAGDLRRTAARKVETHLEGCQRCRETESALAEVPALLAEAEAPPIPAHLAARIETALATEAAHRAAGSPSMRSGVPARRGRSARPARGAPSGRSAQPGRAARTPSRAPWPVPALRILAAAGVFVVIGGGGYELFSHLGGSPAQTASGSSSSDSGSSVLPGRRAPERTSEARPLAPGAAAEPAYGPLVQYGRPGRLATIRPVRTFTDYRPAQLSRQVTAALAATGNAPAVSPGSHAGPAPQTFGGLRTGQLAACVSRIAGGRNVRLVDVAQLNGAPATVIVTAAHGPAAAQIWVVGPGCSRSVSDLLAHQPLAGS
jgi:hypothetical protein